MVSLVLLVSCIPLNETVMLPKDLLHTPLAEAQVVNKLLWIVPTCS